MLAKKKKTSIRRYRFNFTGAAAAAVFSLSASSPDLISARGEEARGPRVGLNAINLCFGPFDTRTLLSPPALRAGRPH